jgi:hypothetical protein
VSWILNTPSSVYTNLEFNVDFPNNPNTQGQDSGPITIDILSQAGSHTIFNSTLSSNGQNFFNAHTTAGDFIRQVTLTGGPWTDAEQVRIGCIASAVPGPSTWAMII